jgi:hypothetical protein
MEDLTMSEVKLNLSDAQRTISGTTHGSIADACVAALSAEPETIAELEAALARYNKPVGDIGPFAFFHQHSTIDEEPWDAGIVVIDLAARIVAFSSTYSRPGPQGEVRYHDGVCATDNSILYRLPADWLFLESIDQYKLLQESRYLERLSSPPLDARVVLYGRPLLEFILREMSSLNRKTTASECSDDGVRSMAAHVGEVSNPIQVTLDQTETTGHSNQVDQLHEQPGEDESLRQQISLIHARWLTTPRDDLRGQTPRDMLLARLELIDYDLHSRSMQWSMLGEGPPCLATDSYAYRFAGFGTHEWVIYYDLVRYLISSLAHDTACTLNEGETQKNTEAALEQEIGSLDRLKAEWLEQPQDQYGGRIPALLIENERIRLPIAMRVHDMPIDDECPVCQMMANDAEWGMEVGFWHLDGAHMDDDFAFSDLRTPEEWEAQRQEWAEFTEKFNRGWEERQQRESCASNIPVEDQLDASELSTTSSDEPGFA